MKRKKKHSLRSRSILAFTKWKIRAEMMMHLNLERTLIAKNKAKAKYITVHCKLLPCPYTFFLRHPFIFHSLFLSLSLYLRSCLFKHLYIQSILNPERDLCWTYTFIYVSHLFSFFCPAHCLCLCVCKRKNDSNRNRIAKSNGKTLLAVRERDGAFYVLIKWIFKAA